VCVDLHLDARAWHKPLPRSLPHMEFAKVRKNGRGLAKKHGRVDEFVQLWHPGDTNPRHAGEGGGVGHDILDSFFRCAEHLRDSLEIARGDAWAAAHPTEAQAYARRHTKKGRGSIGHGTRHHHYGGDLSMPPKEQRYMFIVATDAPQTAVERVTRRLQHRSTDRVSIFGPQLRGLQAHVASALQGEDPWLVERLLQFFVFARCRHSIITRNSQDIRVAVETGAAWRHRREAPTLSEVALNYRVNASTGVWHDFSLGIKGACARGMWRHYQARYQEL